MGEGVRRMTEVGELLSNDRGGSLLNGGLRTMVKEEPEDENSNLATGTHTGLRDGGPSLDKAHTGQIGLLGVMSVHSWCCVSCVG